MDTVYWRRCASATLIRGGAGGEDSRRERIRVSDGHVTPKSAHPAKILPVNSPQFATLEIERENTKATAWVAFSFLGEHLGA
jgi:hypothetical protein